jgi:hypothetical protein
VLSNAETRLAARRVLRVLCNGQGVAGGWTASLSTMNGSARSEMLQESARATGPSAERRYLPYVGHRGPAREPCALKPPAQKIIRSQRRWPEEILERSHGERPIHFPGPKRSPAQPKQPALMIGERQLQLIFGRYGKTGGEGLCSPGVLAAGRRTLRVTSGSSFRPAYLPTVDTGSFDWTAHCWVACRTAPTKTNRAHFAERDEERRHAGCGT